MSSRLPRVEAVDVNKMAGEMMADLLQDRAFQKLWTDMVIDLVGSDLRQTEGIDYDEPAMSSMVPYYS